MDNKLIFSTGAKGGVGKSTLAILMVEALLEGEVTVACLEGDERSPSLAAKYHTHRNVQVATVDLSSLSHDAGLAMLGKAVESLDAQYVVVNTPASGVRVFDELPLVLTSLGREPRATWSLAITADRVKDGADDDGLFASIDGEMLSGIPSTHITVARPLFQCSYRGEPFWCDDRGDLMKRVGMRIMDIPRIPMPTLEAIHRTPLSVSEVATQSDPILSATLLLTWHRIKTALATTVLDGAPVNLTPPPLSLPKRDKIFGEGGIMQQLANEKAKSTSTKTVQPPRSEGHGL
jgi:hypothetical protein